MMMIVDSFGNSKQGYYHMKSSEFSLKVFGETNAQIEGYQLSLNSFNKHC